MIHDQTELFAALAADERTADRLAIIDEIVTATQPITPGDRLVIFSWSPEHGSCYECGLPAAFYVPDAYGPSEVTDAHKRCAVCAANDAVDGERVVRIDPGSGEF